MFQSDLFGIYFAANHTDLVSLLLADACVRLVAGRPEQSGGVLECNLGRITLRADVLDLIR